MGATAFGVGLYFWIEGKEKRKAGAAATIGGGLLALLTVKQLTGMISGVAVSNVVGPAILLFSWGLLAHEVFLRRKTIPRLNQDLAKAASENANLKSQLALNPAPQDLVKLQNEVGDLRNQLASIPTRNWPRGNVFTVQSVKAEHDPNATYRDKVRLVLTNTAGRDLHVWLPVWKSADVFPQHPFGSCFRLEGSTGWRNRDWVKDAKGNEMECSCLEVRAGLTCDCFIGLLPPPGKSIEERLRTHTAVGTATFPVRIDGTLYDVPIEL
jgi:hypothetical protein